MLSRRVSNVIQELRLIGWLIIVFLFIIIVMLFPTLSREPKQPDSISEPSNLTIEQLDTVVEQSKTVRFNVSCVSNSMGQTLNCKNKILAQELQGNDYLVYGQIYIYTKEKENHNLTSLVVHRLVGCADLSFNISRGDKCYRTIFKGDNNAIAEIVSRKDIKYKVLSVEQ